MKVIALEVKFKSRANGVREIADHGKVDGALVLRFWICTRRNS